MDSEAISLEEAIRHAREMASQAYVEQACAQEHQQLADWLEELQAFREARGRLKTPSKRSVPPVNPHERLAPFFGGDLSNPVPQSTFLVGLPPFPDKGVEPS